MSNLGYRLEYFGTGNTATDITEHVYAVEKFADSGTGEITSAKVVLDAAFGDFVTRDNSGDTPLISAYDLFRLTVFSDAGDQFARFLIQDDVSPQKGNGAQLVLELFGLERYLQTMYFPGHFFFVSFADMVRKILTFYNDNRGTGQPRAVASSYLLGNFPAHTYGIFEFGDSTTVYDALMQVVTRMALPVAAGGAGEHYGMTVLAQNRGTIVLDISPRGRSPDSPQTLEGPRTLTQVREPPDGNIVVATGQRGSGSFPREPAMWRSLVEEYENLPAYDAAAEYMEGSYVRSGETTYISLADQDAGSDVTDAARWAEVTFEQYVERWAYAGFAYSPWTHRKAGVWRSWGGNPEGTLAANFDSLCFPDSNLVIRDRAAWRDWVDFRVASLADIPAEYLYDATSASTTVQSRTYFGMRVLVDPAKGTPAAPFTGNDKRGSPFLNSLVMQDRDGDWIVFRSAEYRDECAVLSEGRTYSYTEEPDDDFTGTGQAGARSGRRLHIRPLTDPTPAALAWYDVTDTLMGNDCFHYPKVLEEATGLIGARNTVIDPSPFTARSAIRAVYEFGENGIVESILRKIAPVLSFLGLFFAGTLVDLDDDEKYQAYSPDTYDIGWWITLFEAPYPKSTHNSIRESVGQLFGGDADAKRPVLDLLNLNQTPSGGTGWGRADSAELGELDGLKLLLKFDIDGLDIDALRGDLPFRCTVYDLYGNVWISDTTHRFQGETYEMDLPFSSFSIYRARIQPAFTLSNAVSRIINPELRITEVFERRLVKRITLQCMIGYDVQGRYDPWTWESFLRKLATIATGTVIRYDGTVDAFHFTKTPVAIARGTSGEIPASEMHLMRPILRYPGVSNVIQLQKIADAELEVARFRRESWTATFDGIVLAGAEESVYLKDGDFIPASDAESGEAHTRKYIVRKATYSAGSARSSSGYTTTLELIRRIAT